jgi:superfamily II DNA helicase RecQ
LTATATPATVKIIVKDLDMQGCVHINVSPHKENIKYSVVKVGRPDELEHNFSFLVKMIRELKINMPRIIIFFRQMSHLTNAFEYVDHELGKEGYHNYDPNGVNDDRNHLLEMFVMKTDELVKANIVKTFINPDGHIRVIFCSSSFSMGLNLRKLDMVIHYGVTTDLDDYIQQTGRAGRDENHQAHAVIFLHRDSLKGKNIKREVKDFVKTDRCRRVKLYEAYVNGITPIEPPHKCCDNCAKICNCSDDCDHLIPDVIQRLLDSKEDSVSSDSEGSNIDFNSDSDIEVYRSRKPVALLPSSSDSESCD